MGGRWSATRIAASAVILGALLVMAGFSACSVKRDSGDGKGGDTDVEAAVQACLDKFADAEDGTDEAYLRFYLNNIMGRYHGDDGESRAIVCDVDGHWYYPYCPFGCIIPTWVVGPDGEWTSGQIQYYPPGYPEQIEEFGGRLDFGTGGPGEDFGYEADQGWDSTQHVIWVFHFPTTGPIWTRDEPWDPTTYRPTLPRVPQD